MKPKLEAQQLQFVFEVLISNLSFHYNFDYLNLGVCLLEVCGLELNNLQKLSKTYNDRLRESAAWDSCDFQRPKPELWELHSRNLCQSAICRRGELHTSFQWFKAEPVLRGPSSKRPMTSFFVTRSQSSSISSNETPSRVCPEPSVIGMSKAKLSDEEGERINSDFHLSSDLTFTVEDGTQCSLLHMCLFL